MVSTIPVANVKLPGSYKKTGDLMMTKADGTSSELWKLHNCWPTNINWNELDYSTNDIILVTVSMRFDRATRE